MLMGAGGHENPRTLSLYVKPEPEAVASALAHQDPAAPLTGPTNSTVRAGIPATDPGYDDHVNTAC
jgi:hypothetical protein